MRGFLDHDYAPEILRKLKEYTEAKKKVLRGRKIHFQRCQKKLWVFYEGGICVYNTAEEATKDMARRARRAFQVTVVKPPGSELEKIKGLT